MNQQELSLKSSYSLRSLYIHIILAVFCIFFACSERQQNSENKRSVTHESNELKYAKRFSIRHSDTHTTVYLFGNRKNNDTTNVYILAKDTNELKAKHPAATIIKIPCKSIAALSSIYSAMLAELGETKNITAIDNIDYVNNAEVVKKFEDGQLRELARMPEIDIEQTIVLKPDILFYFGMGYDDGKNKRLQQAGIPLAVCVDHLEQNPLARAEWIKFFAAFTGKKELADSIFSEVEKKYLEIKRLAETSSNRPTVFTEIKFADVWYMPGGKSFMAMMLKDAGADYLWQDNTDFGSLPLSFEQVYSKARDADFWINLPLITSKKELLSQDKRYAEFAAFKSGNLFNNTKNKNAKGYSPYWETGMIHPDRILHDLTLIFHPELKEKINSDLYYYEQLK